MSESEAEAAARDLLGSLDPDIVNDLVLSWKKAGRIDELPKMSEWITRKFAELRGVSPLAAEMHYALSELAWIESNLSAADKCHVYVLASKAWRDFIDEIKLRHIEDHDELRDLYLQRHLDLGISIGIHLEQQPIPPYFDNAASSAHDVAHRAFHEPYW